MILQQEQNTYLDADEKRLVEQWFARKVQNQLDLQSTNNIYPLIMNFFYEWWKKGLVPRTFYTDDREVSLVPFFMEYLQHIFALNERFDYEKEDADFDTVEYFAEFYSVLKVAYEMEQNS